MTLDEKNLRCVWITSNFPKRLTAMTITVVTFFVPNAVTWVTYLHIAFALKRSPAINRNNARTTLTRFKLLRMCIIVALLFTICWFPNQLYFVLASYDLVRLESPFHHFTVVLAMFNSCTNPVIYCSTNREFRKGFLMLLCPFFNSCRWKKRRETSLAQENRLRVATREFQMGKSDGGVMLTFPNLVNQGLFSCGQACYTFAKLPADVDKADCVLTVSVSSTGGKCEYSGKVVPSFIPGDRSPWAPACEKCLIGRYVTTSKYMRSVLSKLNTNLRQTLTLYNFQCYKNNILKSILALKKIEIMGLHLYIYINRLLVILLEVRLFFKIRQVFGDSECVWTKNSFSQKGLGRESSCVGKYFEWIINIIFSSQSLKIRRFQIQCPQYSALRLLLIFVSIFTVSLYPIDLVLAKSSYNINKVYAVLESPPHYFTVVLVMFNSCINPVIYCSAHREYRNAFLTLFRCVFNSRLCKKRSEINLPKEHRLRSISGESEGEKSGGGVVLTSFRDLINQGYEVDNCSQQETSGV
ncbi:unnamed protein product [Porites evermanni]|uniref:G-protein coupled receptors family 1 profile domain-containing protein n=1 Tax=Porites evermanni TaxID=104178 RepID=A0ABN8SLT1_9CNID|nr:unnamed protein product [Porites evermanni]